MFDPAESENKQTPYTKPLLRKEGDILDITLGGSPGAGDSGAGSLVENIPGQSQPFQGSSGQGAGFADPTSDGSKDPATDLGSSDEGSSGEGSGFFTP